MKKILLIWICFASVFASEILLDDFSSLSANLTVLPGSAPVIFSPAKANILKPQGQALRLTGKAENPIILKFTCPAGKLKNVTANSSLVFYVKSDTDSVLELALEEKNLGPFLKLSDFLPAKEIKKYWQKARIPLSPFLIKPAFLKAFYLKINPPSRDTRAVIYLDEIAVNTAQKKDLNSAPGLMLYNFDAGLSNSFSASPSVFTLPGSVSLLTATEKGHYGKDGKSLSLAFNNPYGEPGELFLPILKNAHPFKAEEYTSLSWQLRSELNFKYSVIIYYKNNFQSKKKLYPHSLKLTQIDLPDTFWHYIELPLEPESKKELIGLGIVIPAKTQGRLYLDDIILK